MEEWKKEYDQLVANNRRNNLGLSPDATDAECQTKEDQGFKGYVSGITFKDWMQGRPKGQ